MLARAVFALQQQSVVAAKLHNQRRGTAYHHHHIRCAQDESATAHDKKCMLLWAHNGDPTEWHAHVNTVTELVVLFGDPYMLRFADVHTSLGKIEFALCLRPLLCTSP